MKAAISILTTLCGTALLITQYLHDGFVSGGPAYCEYVGLCLCVAGVVMGFKVIGAPAPGLRREPAAA
jgi:hypothetical protein